MLQRITVLLALISAVPGSAAVPAGPVSPFAADPLTSPAVSPCSPEDGWALRRGQEALASLRVADASGYDLVFLEEREGFYGLTRPRYRRVEVYVRPCAEQSPELLRHVVAHELGHAYDAVRLTDEDRRQWLRARGVPAGTPWYGCSGCTDFDTPAGDFAEVHAQWSRGASTNRSTLAPIPTPAELERLAARFFPR